MGLSLARNLKYGLFHLGSGMADVLTTGLWNRVMISDLGYSATPIGLLLGLRYFLAPLGLWAGRMSDAHLLGGYRRLTWIWIGRALMALSLFSLGLATATLARGAANTALMWLVITLSLLLFSFGNALSGSTFLALIHDRASAAQRGRAVGLVWTFLLLGFTIGGILFSIMLPSSDEGDGSLDPGRLAQVFVVAALVLGGLWFFALLGEEKRHRGVKKTPAAETSFRADLRFVWQQPRTRWFLIYLVLSMCFAFVQDLVLEPFAAEVFDMSVEETTRFAAWWGGMSIVGSLLFLGLSRRIRALNNTRMAAGGVLLLIATFTLFGMASLGGLRQLITPGLLLLGLGLGLWNIGTLGLMMDMSPVGRAGTFLGFWSLVVTLARGAGVSGGGILRDLALLTGGGLQLAYAAVFLIEVAGLAVALYALSRVGARELQLQQAPDQVLTQAGTLD